MLNVRRLVPMMALAAGMTLAGPAHAAVPLVEAARRGDVAAVRAEVRRNADVNVAAPDGTTALHWAAQRGDLETAHILLGAGAAKDTATVYGVTPLALACMGGHAALAALLLDAGVDPDTALPGGETPLMTAARTGNVPILKTLISRRARVNAAEESTAQTALMWAAAEGHVAAITTLVDAGADVAARSRGGWTAFLFAVREGQMPAVRALLDAGADVNDALLLKRGRPGAGGSEVAARASSALVLAVANAHYEIAALLLDRGADPNAAAQGWTALHQVTWVRKPGQGSTGPGPSGSGSVSSLDLVRKLAQHDADLNARMTSRAQVGVTALNMIGATPFLMAARSADAPLMRLLADLGADTRLPNQDGATPLIVAAGLGTHSPGEDPGTEAEVLEAVKVALALGNDINAVDNNGNTAMHGAAYKQVPSVVDFLAASGADISVWNQKNKQGWTPLRIAAGVFRGGMFRFSVPTADRFRTTMTSAGASIALEDAVSDTVTARE
jgi:ankyrin repeat protein